MDKPIKDLTLAEVREICNALRVCDDCPLSHPDNGPPDFCETPPCTWLLDGEEES